MTKINLKKLMNQSCETETALPTTPRRGVTQMKNKQCKSMVARLRSLALRIEDKRGTLGRILLGLLYSRTIIQAICTENYHRK